MDKVQKTTFTDCNGGIVNTVIKRRFRNTELVGLVNQDRLHKEAPTLFTLNPKWLN
jgi:hypothetical protein